MEKYRKFEDAENGINPFIPSSIKKRETLSILIYFFQFILGFCAFLIFISLSFLNLLLNLIQKIIFLPNLKRKFAVFKSSLLGRSMLFTLGIFNLNYKHKKNSNKIPNIILSSQSSVIDWIYLYYLYAPKFLWIIKSEDSKKVKKK